MRDIARQLRTDFGHVPDLVDEFVVHTPRKEAVKASRQVCGVSHYLSLMLTGEVDMHKCAMFGVAITCIDEVTDEMGEDLYPDAIYDAIHDGSPYESLEIIHPLVEMAESRDIESLLVKLCRQQDRSRRQLGDISTDEVRRITFKKGGLSARCNAAMFADIGVGNERTQIAHFGYLMQLLDDYLDQPKDKSQGLKTLFTGRDFDRGKLSRKILDTRQGMGDTFGYGPAHTRFFRICRLHMALGRVENESPFRASWFAPGYL